MSTAGAALEQIRAEGYAIVPDLLAPTTIEGIRSELAPLFATAPFGRNDFEGFRSQRLYALLAKAPSTAGLVEHPTLAGILAALLHPHYLLSAHLAINVHPGETAQMYHADDGYCSSPRPRAHVGVSAIWAIDDFTADNGATQVLPGSHEWGSAPVDADDPRLRTIEMSAGSMLVFLGTTYHRGGANTSDRTRLGITPQFCEPWIRQIETMALAVPPDVAAAYSPQMQSLLGYSLLPPFIGYVDGRDPRRLIPPAARQH